MAPSSGGFEVWDLEKYVDPLHWYTLPETNSSPLKIGKGPQKGHSIPTIHFQVRTVSFEEGSFKTFLKKPGQTTQGSPHYKQNKSLHS